MKDFRLDELSGDDLLIRFKDSWVIATGSSPNSPSWKRAVARYHSARKELLHRLEMYDKQGEK